MKLGAIWSEVLQIENTGVRDNFFDLDGHSLTANQVITGVSEAFQLKLTLKTLLESPTVLKMTAWICQRQRDAVTESRREELMRHNVNPHEVFSIRFPKEEVQQSIPDRFEKIVCEYPHHPAVELDDEILTYAELNARSNCLARSISKRGLHEAHPVALLFGKGSAQIIAMLSVLKAGKFFVLLDPSLSAERIAAILDDTGSELLLHDKKNAALATQVTPGDCRLLQPESTGDDNSTENLGRRIAPDELAYVVYTLGSTGKPKGVIQNHQNVLHGTMLRVRRDHLSPTDRFAHVSSGTSNEITNAFYTLLTGAAMVVFDLRKRGVDRLAPWLIQERITLCSFATPLFRKVCETLSGAEKFPHLRLIGLGGDAVLKSDVEFFEKFFPPNCALVTALSATETGALTETLIPKAHEMPGNEVPIGRPQLDKDIYLLDEDGRRVGFNEVGEIVVRSKYLSPGYWNRPELNEAKFKTDPEDPEQRLYYTGDLALMLPDGYLVHKGRKDFRVKIRGYGVELAEVETALRGHEAVKNCVIVGRKDQSGETKLVAYYVGASQHELNVSELRQYLMSSLPDYMVPSTFQWLDSIPLTTNGKVDRKALPEPDRSRPELSVSYEAPKTPVEMRIAEVWAETLSVDRVGRDDNFFDLGGHSLMGARIITKVKEEYGVELSVGELLSNPTVAEIAACIEPKRNEEKIERPWTESGSNKIPTVGNPREVISIGFSREEVEQSIPERFEKIVALYPDRIAVQAENRAVSYAELNAMANSMAHEIVKRRGTESEAIGLLMGKGVEQIAAMIGVLKAGKYFVLMDASSPRSRIAGILQDSQASVIVADQQNLALANETGIESLRSTTCFSTQIGDLSETLRPSISSYAFAYIVYTSGSTGRPKGVIQSHRNLLHNIRLRTQSMPISPLDRIAQLPSGTAIAVTNAFSALFNGATLMPFDVRTSGIQRLALWLKENKISILWISAPLFRNLCDILTRTNNFPSLRLLRLTSEASYKRDVDLYKKYFDSKCLLVNALHATETGPMTFYFIDHNTKIEDDVLPVGYPVKDKEVLLLDDNGKRVGFNEVGEIVVRSKYLSPGYLNRPESNDAKFKVDAEDPEQRIYYTGDLGLILPSGCLIHKGRKDFRVKIRGYGVEIAEVEKALRGHESVKDCVIVDQKDQSGETKLVAYYVGNSQREPNVSELRQHLMSLLPDYMVPSTFKRLDAIPLTPNGKLDRHALPEPDGARPELSVCYEAPRTAVEKRIAEFWAETLSVDSVGLHDNFFDLGGHSLSGSLVVSWIHQTFGMDLPVSEFFANPTVARLAQRIEGNSGDDHKAVKKRWTYLCELQKGKNRAPIFFFPGGGGGEPEFFVYGLLARHVGTEYPFYGLRARGADGVLQPHTSVVQMADAYVEEIRSIQPKGPYYLIGECCGGVNAYEAARQLVTQGQEVAMLVLMDVERPTPIKYLRFRAGKWLNATEEYLDATVLKQFRESYYVQRLPHHLRQLASLSLRDYPGYLAGRLVHSLKPPRKPPLTIASRHEREEIVLFTMASGDELKHIERVRENYRRKVRRFRPRPYTGPVDLIVSEKLFRRDSTLGWHDLVPEGLQVHPAPGNHWTYIREHVAETGLKLRECLEQAKKRTRSRNG